MARMPKKAKEKVVDDIMRRMNKTKPAKLRQLLMSKIRKG